MKIVIDFDSTFIKTEALDELANLKSTTSNELVEQIKSLTNKAMSGEISFAKALTQRIQLLQITQQDVAQLTNVLQTKITDSFLENKKWIAANAENIFIVSGGFKEYITPVVAQFGITANHVIANTFIFENDKVISVDTNNPLSKDGGKVLALQQLNWQEEVFVIGDGFTDYEIKKAGLAKKFYCFTENIQRTEVMKNADLVIHNFNQFINDTH